MGACCCCCNDVNDYRTTAYKRVMQSGTDVEGKVCIITGANGTIGTALSAALYAGGATVVMAGRSMKKLEKAREVVMAEHPQAEGQLKLLQLDLADYESINKFVEEFSKEHKTLDVLVNNAGIVPKFHYRASKYGYELTFQINYLSTYVLTEALLKYMEDTKSGARVINVGTLSIDEASKPIAWDQFPRNESTFGGYHVDYGESKWMITCYTEALTRRFAKSGVNIKAVTADPGIITGSQMWDDQGCVEKCFGRYLCYCITKTPEQGASTSAQCAVLPFDELKAGGYYHSGLPYESRPDCREDGSVEKLEALTARLLKSKAETKNEDSKRP
mmetsp:Transcript_12540/g.18740  ORF Transcript_12540/g.18740 Transcript_12540/m.18740 type:complete len:331 (+) Transcript_12540:47-1039(+)